MYAAVLDSRRRPELRGVDHAHQYALNRLERGLAPLAPGVERSGTSDLTLPANGDADAFDHAHAEHHPDTF